MEIKRVLILTTNYGDGHIKTADSLLNQFKAYDPTIEVKIVNLYDEAHPIINKAIRYTYLKCYSLAPKLYDFVYYLTKHPSRNFYFNNVAGLLGRIKLKEYLNDFKPDLIINTYSVLAVPMLRKKGYTNIPCYTIITDYGVHSQWIDPGVHKYFVAHECVKDVMLDWGIEDEKVEVSGIPVSLECSSDVNTEGILEKYGINNQGLPIITLLGGANSVMRNMSEMCEKLYSTQFDAQFVIVCGRNKLLKEKLERELSRYSDRIKIFGYVDSLHEIMKASDIVISKPGGLTVTEMLSLETPLVIYGSPAGQEKENAKFLLKNGCSFHAKNINQLITILDNLVKEKDTLLKMRISSNRVKRPSGSSIIVNSIIKDFKEMNEYKKPVVEKIGDVIGLKYGDIN